MGWQDVTVLFYGVPLADGEADKVLGMVARYQRVRLHGAAGVTAPAPTLLRRLAQGRRPDPLGVTHGVPLPGEAKDTLFYKSSPNVGGPLTEQLGRMWVGVQIGEMGPPLPEDRREQVWTANAPEVEGCFDPSALPAPEAMARWDHFAVWCQRRGVELPPAGLYVVADYD